MNLTQFLMHPGISFIGLVKEQIIRDRYFNATAKFAIRYFKPFYITLQYFTSRQILFHKKFNSKNKFEIFSINVSPTHPWIDPAAARLAPLFHQIF